MKKSIFLLLALPFCVCVTTVYATVIDTTDILFGGNTYRTFQDDTTSLTWLDLNNFWDGTTTYNSLTSTLLNSGFHLASVLELSDLQLSIPAIPSNFLTEATIVGGNHSNNPNISRNIIWGIYEDGNAVDGVSYSWKRDTDVFWFSSTNALAATSTFASLESDLGAWVVADSIAAVPEPSTIILFGTGLVVLAVLNYKRGKQTTLTGYYSRLARWRK